MIAAQATDKARCSYSGPLRPDRVLAGLALIAALALVAVPSTVGRQARQSSVSVHRLAPVVIDAASETATSVNPAATAAARVGRLDPLVEPGAILPARARPDAPSVVAQAGSIPARAPAPRRGSTAGSVGGGWHTAGSSWYGPGFYGSGTACGRTYTRTIVGVAHRTLPCGTLVEFRNPTNGRVVDARVIDRGPYVSGRLWDLSRALCVALDHCYTAPIEWRLP
jgi:type II secretory pathway pseudopilin PulG